MHTGAQIAVVPILGCTVHGTTIKGAVQDHILPSPVPASRVFGSNGSAEPSPFLLESQRRFFYFLGSPGP